MNREAIDLSKIKVGDEVTVRCVVKALHENPKWPAVVDLHSATQSLALVQPGKPYDGRAYVFAEAIVSHTPKALEVGDRVTMRGWGKATLRLLCIHGPWAWMADDEDTTIQGPLAHLERA